jgi:Peptidase family M23
MVRSPRLLTCLAVVLLHSLAPPAATAEPLDGIAPADQTAIANAMAKHLAAREQDPAATTAAKVAPVYPFFPQAGQLGADLSLYNFTDLEPGADVIGAWDCSRSTYDGHRGHDSLIRSFREQDIGVPVFAVLPGVVVDTHDGEFDRQVAWVAQSRGNYVVLDHGDGYSTLYFHLRAGSVAVAVGQVVAAGMQLGLTASSGMSSWPHLHFESWKNGAWFEPSAGPCRAGASFWAEQPSAAPEVTLADFAMGEGTVPDDRNWFIEDAGTRRGAFVKGRRQLYQRLDVHSLPAESQYHLRVFDPRRTLVLEENASLRNRDFERLALLVLGQDLDLARTGTWRYVLEINDQLVVDVPFAVVASAANLQNRAPRRITVVFAPAPRAGEVPRCTVRTSLAAEDPDFDVLRYLYEWRVGTRVVRSVASAATSDYLATDQFAAGDKIRCRVVPSDGRRKGPAATATAIASE